MRLHIQILLKKDLLKKLGLSWLPKAILLNILICANCCAESNAELYPGFIPLVRFQSSSKQSNAVTT